MYVFIDDSGDPGFKFDKGSSRFFVIACCVFETAEAAELTSERFRSLLREFRWGDKAEFKFSKTRREIHERLLTDLFGLPFRVHAVLVDKLALAPQREELRQEDFYLSAIARVLSAIDYRDAGLAISIDGRGDREYRLGARVMFSRVMPERDGKRISKLRFVDSRSSPLVQLADLYAGAVRRSAQPEYWDYEKLLQTYRSRGCLEIERIP
jgi:hypothetical protein